MNWNLVIAALEAAAIANSQSLDEINATNAASFDNLLIIEYSTE